MLHRERRRKNEEEHHLDRNVQRDCRGGHDLVDGANAAAVTADAGPGAADDNSGTTDDNSDSSDTEQLVNG